MDWLVIALVIIYGLLALVQTIRISELKSDLRHYKGLLRAEEKWANSWRNKYLNERKKNALH